MHPRPDAKSGESIDYPGRTGDMAPQPDHGERSYRGCGRLDGRRAVITGGDSGIGRAIALAFAREGADVLLTHLPAEADDAAESARLVQEAGRRAVVLGVDIRAGRVPPGGRARRPAPCNPGRRSSTRRRSRPSIPLPRPHLIPATMPEGKTSEFGADTPLGRAGQPAECAPAFVFLASQESSYVSGEYIAVTGGKLT